MKKVQVLLALFPFLCFPQLQVKNYFSVTGKKDVPANVIAQDATGFLILGTAEGAFRFDGRVAEPIPSGDFSLKKDITAIFVDPAGSVWLGTRQGKVFVVTENRIDSVDFTRTPN